MAPGDSPRAFPSRGRSRKGPRRLPPAPAALLCSAGPDGPVLRLAGGRLAEWPSGKEVPTGEVAVPTALACDWDARRAGRDAARNPGRGRILLLTRSGDGWSVEGSIELRGIPDAPPAGGLPACGDARHEGGRGARRDGRCAGAEADDPRPGLARRIARTLPRPAERGRGGGAGPEDLHDRRWADPGGLPFP